MRAPRFWFTPPNRPTLTAHLLAPLGALYAKATAKRVAQPGQSIGVPVICIGNLNAGGTGKTPTAIAFAQRLLDRNVAVHAVSRGYGGSLDGPVRVNEQNHTADQVGDEPLLLGAFLPTWVAKDRLAGAKAAVDAGAQAILLDDGFQNPALQKDLSIIVVDAGKGFGNGRVIPSGPLREPVGKGLERADFILSIGPQNLQERFADLWANALTIPHITGELCPLKMGMDWEGTRAIAFAGIGHPEKFFASLRASGVEIVREVALSDHQPFTDALLHRIESDARQLGAQMVTTEKDAARLPAAFRPKVLTFPVRLKIDDWSAVDVALDRLFA